MPSYLVRRAPARNRHNDLPDLFSWRPVTSHPSRAVLKLAARYGLTLAHAATVARLAGLGADREVR